MTQRQPTFREILADDGYAATFQSMGQYRTALLRAFAGHERLEAAIVRRMGRTLASVAWSLSGGEWKKGDGNPFAEIDHLAHKVALELDLYRGTYGEMITTSSAARDVLAERQRQLTAECWTPEHDDHHVCDEIAAFAAWYAMPPGVREWPADSTGYGKTLGEAIVPQGWVPKPSDRRRELVKAGALTLAEIERLDRAAARDGTTAHSVKCSTCGHANHPGTSCINISPEKESQA